MKTHALLGFIFLTIVSTTVFEGIPGKEYWKIKHNQYTLNKTLHGLRPNDHLRIDGKFYLQGGIEVCGLENITISINGELQFGTVSGWPTSLYPEYQKLGGHPQRPAGYKLDCLHICNSKNITITSKTRGILDGGGIEWWTTPGIGYLLHLEDRPKLLQVSNSSDILIENMMFRQSPYWTLWFNNITHGVIRNLWIYARRTMAQTHTIMDWSAFNTDGIDLTSCKYIHIYNASIWVQDDAIAVKDNTSHILIEHVNASGMGLAIGSIGHSQVTNVTFRNCKVMESAKGIYIKFREAGLISNITYENIWMHNVQQPIWIGPAQQSNSFNPCHANPCSLCWPWLSTCNIVEGGEFHNINIFASHTGSVILAPSNETIQIHSIPSLALSDFELKVLFPFMDIPVYDSFVILICASLLSFLLLPYLYKRNE